MKRSIRLLILCSLLAGFGSAGASDSASGGGFGICFDEPSVGVSGFIHDLPGRVSCVWNHLVQ